LNVLFENATSVDGGDAVVRAPSFDWDSALSGGVVVCFYFIHACDEGEVAQWADFLAATETAEESYRIATGYMQQQQWDKALERLDDALAADPQDASAHNARGVVLTHLGDYDEAYRMFERAEKLAPTDAGIRLNMAIVRHLQGRRHEAPVIYRQLLEMEPSYQGYLDILEEE